MRDRPVFATFVVTSVAMALVVPAWWIEPTWLRGAWVIVVAVAFLTTLRRLSRR